MYVDGHFTPDAYGITAPTDREGVIAFLEGKSYGGNDLWQMLRHSSVNPNDEDRETLFNPETFTWTEVVGGIGWSLTAEDIAKASVEAYCRDNGIEITPEHLLGATYAAALYKDVHSNTAGVQHG